MASQVAAGVTLAALVGMVLLSLDAASRALWRLVLTRAAAPGREVRSWVIAGLAAAAVVVLAALPGAAPAARATLAVLLPASAWP